MREPGEDDMPLDYPTVDGERLVPLGELLQMIALGLVRFRQNELSASTRKERVARAVQAARRLDGLIAKERELRTSHARALEDLLERLLDGDVQPHEHDKVRELETRLARIEKAIRECTLPPRTVRS